MARRLNLVERTIQDRQITKPEENDEMNKF